jgi:protein tyrosine/serine phosphatase
MSTHLRRLIVAFLLSCSAAAVTAGPRGAPAREGILNFGKVSDTLYRGAQPDTNGINNLKKLGIKTIISLRQPGTTWTAEAAAAQAAGLVYTNFPMSGMGKPKAEQVRMILATIDSLPGPVFVHCAHGCDRTGTIVACYRIQHDKWTTASAQEEADHYGMSGFERGMRIYITEFGKAAQPGVEKIADAKQ